jgi:parvulin-like peptidyl-prolyl isomerase
MEESGVAGQVQVARRVPAAPETTQEVRTSERRHLLCRQLRPIRVVLVLVGLSLLALGLFGNCGCGGEREGEAGGLIDEARLPTPPAVPPDRVAASHILIAYRDAALADSSVTRSREEAERLATVLCRRARRPGADFPTLAREHSDGPTALGGGYLDVFQRGEMIQAFEEAAFGMEVGQISGVVETPFGFHVIRRDPIEQVAASHILVQWQGARDSERPGEKPITRSREEARQRAETALERISAPGADFAVLAGEFSDCPTAPRGGDLGRFGRGGVMPPIEEAAFGLEVGEISGIIETEFGYHIVKRTE